MPRRTAVHRHEDSRPPEAGTRTAEVELVDALVAVHHPVRRRLLETLAGHGPATVGRLAESLDLAVGSVSHHLKPLHASGFVAPAPELARDARESWWRTTPRRLSFDSAVFPEGSAVRELVALAERANDDWHAAAITEWRQRRATFPPAWRHAAGSSDAFVAATPEQLSAVASRLDEVLTTWSHECRADEERHPDLERQPVFAFARANPVRR